MIENESFFFLHLNCVPTTLINIERWMNRICRPGLPSGHDTGQTQWLLKTHLTEIDFKTIIAWNQKYLTFQNNYYRHLAMSTNDYYGQTKQMIEMDEKLITIHVRIWINGLIFLLSRTTCQDFSTRFYLCILYSLSNHLKKEFSLFGGPH